MTDADRPVVERARTLARAGVLRVAPPLRRLIHERDELRREHAALARRTQDGDRRTVDLTAERDRLLEEVAQLRVGADPFDYQYLFVIAYGRSGSTLVQGLLNSIPGYLIRGENNDAFHRLGSWHRVLVTGKREHAAAVNPTYAWFGIGNYDETTALTLMRALALDTLLRPQPDTRVIGFKEIRWWHPDWAKHLTFMRELFPGARFVLNSRNHEQVAKSKWWAERPDALERLSRYEQQLDEMGEFLGDAGYRLHFDDFVADPDRLRGLFDWLGEPFDRERIDAVLAVKHSS